MERELNGVNYYNYAGTFLRTKFIYDKLVNRLEKLKSLNGVYNDENLYVVKDCLQNYYRYGIPFGTQMLKKEMLKREKQLFDWLDNVKDPYFFIYYRDMERRTEKCVHDLYYVNGTGINFNTHYLSKRYALR